MTITPVDAILKTVQKTPATDNLLLSIPGFQNHTYNQGIVETVFDRRNGAGELVYDGSKITERKGLITLSFSRSSPELLALMSAAEFDAAAAITGEPYAASFRVPPDRALEAAGTGIFGEGVPIDDPTFFITANINGVSRKLTRVADAAFDAATDTLSYEVLANAAINFSDDVPVNALVTLQGSYDAAAALKMNQAINRDAFELLLLMNSVDNGQEQIGRYKFTRVVLAKQDNSNIDVSASPINIVFRDESGNCIPDLVFPGLNVKC